jgi:hypothetical protein
VLLILRSHRVSPGWPRRSAPGGQAIDAEDDIYIAHLGKVVWFCHAIQPERGNALILTMPKRLAICSPRVPDRRPLRSTSMPA